MAILFDIPQLSIGLRKGVRWPRQFVRRYRHVLRPTAELGALLLGEQLVRVICHAAAHGEHAESRIQGDLRVLGEFRQSR